MGLGWHVDLERDSWWDWSAGLRSHVGVSHRSLGNSAVVEEVHDLAGHNGFGLDKSSTGSGSGSGGPGDSG
jgi:hypothetical protein